MQLEDRTVISPVIKTLPTNKGTISITIQFFFFFLLKVGVQKEEMGVHPENVHG